MEFKAFKAVSGKFCLVIFIHNMYLAMPGIHAATEQHQMGAFYGHLHISFLINIL